MKREDLDHIIRASGNIWDEYKIRYGSDYFDSRPLLAGQSGSRQ
jgi:hypothetical protein